MSEVLFKKTCHNKVDLLFDGNDYDELYIKLINEAVESIHIQVYIFDIDEFGKRVFESILQAKKRGVEVYVLVDAVGSNNLDEQRANTLQEAGVHFCKFNGIAFERLYKWGRRLHHKVLLTDQNKAIVGGINIVSPYVDSNFQAPRLDFAVYLEGPITKELTSYCEDLFTKNFGSVQFTLAKWPISHEDGFEAQVSVNDWMQRRSQITKDYIDLVDGAKNEITIINSYFFPRRRFMKRLAEASKRGVKVRLILAKYSDWPSWILASEYLYYYFLKHDIEIYLWNKSILHGKIATVDGRWSTIGSFNLNYTSYQGNLEMNIDVFSDNFAKDLDKRIDDLITTGCEKVDPVEFRNIFSLPKRFFYYLLLSVISNFSLAFIFQEDEQNHDVAKITAIARLVVAAAFMAFGIFGLLVPGIVGFPFVAISLFILSKHFILNKTHED